MAHETTRDFVPEEWEYDFDAAVAKLLVGIEAKYAESFPNAHRKLNLSLTAGSKFVKVLEGHSVWGFIAKADGVHKGLPMVEGDVFKPASYKAAAKHVRGNIYDGKNNWYAWTGPNYLIYYK